MKKNLTLIAIILGLLPLHIYHARAVEPAVPQILRVSPAILPISLIPGKTLNLILTIENLTVNPIPLKAEVESFESADEEGGYTFPASQSPLVSWISIDRPDMIVNPGLKREIAVTIKIPPQVAVGGYYAVIFLTPYGPAQPDNPKIVPRIGVPVFASLGIDENMKSGSIETFTLTPSLSRSGVFTYTLRVKNTGLSHFTSKPVIRAKSVFGKEQTRDISEKVILPGKIRRWEGNLNLTTAPGLYTVEASVPLGTGICISQKTTVTVFPWPEIMAAIITILILWFFVRNGKNITKAIKIFLK